MEQIKLIRTLYITDIIKNNLHLGTKKINAKMRPFIIGRYYGYAILNIFKIYVHILKIKFFVTKIIINTGNSNVLFISTDKLLASVIEQLAHMCTSSYINDVCKGGILTNFKFVSKRKKKQSTSWQSRKKQDISDESNFDVAEKETEETQKLSSSVKTKSARRHPPLNTTKTPSLYQNKQEKLFKTIPLQNRFRLPSIKRKIILNKLYKIFLLSEVTTNNIKSNFIEINQYNSQKYVDKLQILEKKKKICVAPYMTITKNLKSHSELPKIKRKIVLEKFYQSVDAGEQSVDAGERSVNAGKQSVNAGERSVDARERSVDAGEQSVNAGERSVNAGEQSVDAGEQSVDARERSVDAGKQSVDAGEQSVDAGERIYDPNQTTLVPLAQKKIFRYPVITTNNNSDINKLNNSQLTDQYLLKILGKKIYKIYHPKRIKTKNSDRNKSITVPSENLLNIAPSRVQTSGSDVAVSSISQKAIEESVSDIFANKKIKSVYRKPRLKRISSSKLSKLLIKDIYKVYFLEPMKIKILDATNQTEITRFELNKIANKNYRLPTTTFDFSKTNGAKSTNEVSFTSPVEVNQEPVLATSLLNDKNISRPSKKIAKREFYSFLDNDIQEFFYPNTPPITMEQYQKERKLEDKTKKLFNKTKKINCQFEEKKYEYIKTVLENLPQVVIIIGQQKEMKIIKECQKLNILTISISDSDGDPALTNLFIPANDDNPVAVEYMLKHLAEATEIGKIIVAFQNNDLPLWFEQSSVSSEKKKELTKIHEHNYHKKSQAKPKEFIDKVGKTLALAASNISRTEDKNKSEEKENQSNLTYKRPRPKFINKK